MMRTKNPRPFKHCPAFHCVFGFEAAELQAYGDKFNTQVPKFKHQLIAILRNDQDDLKRGAAAYLLAHLADGREVVAALSPSMRDSSSHVRNNVMRVLAQTATHIHDANFPLADAIRALTYPTTTDRNKALYMLDMLTADPKSANYVRLNGCHQLMEQFKLVQPNLHDESYNVLVKISQQHYPDTDFMAWDNWVANHCANAVSA